MDYEKMYKAVLKTATQWIEDGCSDKEKICLESIFPELRESEDERIIVRLIEYFKGFLEGHEDCYKDGGCVKWEGLDVKSILAFLEKQKKTADSFTDGIIEVRSFQRGMEEGRKLETQKEPGIKWLKSDNVKNPDKPYIDKAGMFYTTDGRMCYASEIEKQKEQKPVEYLSKDKVYAIMSKLTKLSTSNLIPFNSPEYKKINEITSDVRSLLDYPIEEKPRWEINNPHTTKWTKEMIDEKFEELVEEYHKQKPVVTHGETYHVDTLGTQQVIAGKMPQKPAEWSEEDEEMIGNCIDLLEHFPLPYGEVIGSWKDCIAWLKSLPERFNIQPKQKQNDYITPHKEFFKFIYDRLINVHKENPNVDYMRSFKERLNNLSFGEKQEWSDEDERKLQRCIEIVESWEGDYDIAYTPYSNFLKSLRPSWKPSEEQMEALKCAVADIARFSKRGGRQVELENEPYYSALHSLYCNLEKLM